MSPNIVRTNPGRLLAIAMVLAVQVSAAGCKASGHIDFDIDIPAVELAAKPSTEDHKP